MKQLLFLFIATLLFTGCSKENKKAAINATVYLDDELVYSNIAFIPAGDNYVVESRETVTSFFNDNAANGSKYTTQHKEYMKPGSYLIVVQIADEGKRQMIGAYSYKRVTVSEGNPSMENVMVFTTEGGNNYQEWNNKY